MNHKRSLPSVGLALFFALTCKLAIAQVSAPSTLTSTSSGQLPRSANQEYRQYDLSRYVEHLAAVNRPEKAVVDWILRETGTDLWFSEPFGFLNASREGITVYHTPEMHQIVKSMVDRFTLGPTEPVILKMRLATISNPNWRVRALPLLQDVTVQSPGVQAWLVTKENAAVLASLLRARTDTKVIHDLSFEIYNGQSKRLEKMKGRNFVRTIRKANRVWPPYEPEIGEVQEGYKLEISPLLSLEDDSLECVIEASIDQVDKLIPVDLELPLPNGQSHRARIEVPQIVSWRLHERFRWSKDMVLVLSCGVVASPDRKDSTIPYINLDRFMGNTPGRADALLFIAFGGKASAGLAPPAQVANQNTGVSRGRY